MPERAKCPLDSRKCTQIEVKNDGAAVKAKQKRQAPPRKSCTGRGNCGAAAKERSDDRRPKQRQVP